MKGMVISTFHSIYCNDYSQLSELLLVFGCEWIRCKLSFVVLLHIMFVKLLPQVDALFLQ